MDALETDAVTAVVADGTADRNRATGELIGDDLRQFPYAVVLGVLTHIEDLAAHRVLWRDQTAVDRLANVLDMYHGTPRATIARHGNAPGRPGQRAQIVDDNVKAHAR